MPVAHSRPNGVVILNYPSEMRQCASWEAEWTNAWGWFVRCPMVNQSEKQLQNLIAKIKSDKLIFKRLRMLKLEIESGVTCSAGYAMACPASLTFVLDLIVPINIFVSRDLEMSPDGH